MKLKPTFYTTQQVRKAIGCPAGTFTGLYKSLDLKPTGLRHGKAAMHLWTAADVKQLDKAYQAKRAPPAPPVGLRTAEICARLGIQPTTFSHLAKKLGLKHSVHTRQHAGLGGRQYFLWSEGEVKKAEQYLRPQGTPAKLATPAAAPAGAAKSQIDFHAFYVALDRVTTEARNRFDRIDAKFRRLEAQLRDLGLPGEPGEPGEPGGGAPAEAAEAAEIPGTAVVISSTAPAGGFCGCDLENRCPKHPYAPPPAAPPAARF